MASGTASGVNVKAIAAVLIGLGVAGAVAVFATRDDGLPRDEAAMSEGAGSEDPVSEDAVSEDAVSGDLVSGDAVSGDAVTEEGSAAPETVEPETAGPAPGDTAADTTPPPDPPRFDQIRVAPDGSTVIAGQAPSGSEVSLRLDGEEIGTARSGGSGDFAAILMLSPSDRPRIMSLVAMVSDGTELPGVDSVIIAPFGMSIAAPEAEPGTTESAAAETADPAPPAPASDGEGGAATDSAATGAADGTDTAPEPAPAPEETASEETARDETAPEETARDETAPEETARDETASEGTVPAETAPDETAPEEAPAPEVAAAPPEAPDPGDSPPEAAGPPAIGEAPDTAEAPPEVPETPQAVAAAPSIVIASPEGVRVVQDPGGAPEAQTEVQIDAITYTTEGEVGLSGRGPADSQVQILLNNRPVQLGEIGPGGQWSLELPDVDPGTYTLTVAQLSPEGEIESRVDTPFLREDPARVAASPMRVGDGVTVITVQPGFTLWGIAEANFGQGISYVQIFEENRDRIRDPDWIFPGQIFRLPDLPRQDRVD